MEAKKEIDLLRKKFISLKSDKEIEDFDEVMKTLYNSKSDNEKAEFVQAFKESAKEEFERAEQIYNDVSLRLKLEKILDIVSMSYISEHYFKKSRSWFSQRLNANKVNGVPVSFSSEELKTLSNALSEISDELKKAACSI